MNARISPLRPHLVRTGNWRGAFTLVELLVVITIIAMLMGLLIPAVQSARRSSQRASCMNNNQQLGKAILQYVTNKDKFPPSVSAQPLSPNLAMPYMVGWVPPILPYIEQNPLYQVFQNGWANGWLLYPAGKDALVSVLVCPSRFPSSPAPLSYVVNSGMTDLATGLAAGTPMDWAQNGVFFDNFIPAIGTKAMIDLTDINRRDGTSMTILFSENVDALDWIYLPNTHPTNQPQMAPPYLGRATSGNQSLMWWQGIVWFNSDPPPILLNKGTGVGLTALSATNDNYARPSSNHPGGFIVTMCDGHSLFMSEDVEYRVYANLMTPDGTNAKIPGQTTLVQYPAAWHVMGNLALPLTPITESDLK